MSEGNAYTGRLVNRQLEKLHQLFTFYQQSLEDIYEVLFFVLIVLVAAEAHCLLYVSSHVSAGLEINNLRQWTTEPPSLRIWWSGLKSGGPENYSVIRAYTIHFHSKFITERIQS